MTKYKIYKKGDRFFVKIKGCLFYWRFSHYEFNKRSPPFFVYNEFKSEEEAEQYMVDNYGKQIKRVTKARLI